jgi:hypothetical protein
LKSWLVITPEYDEVEPILDDGTGPTWTAADVIEIEAETARDALILGVKEMLRGHVGGTRYQWCIDQREDCLSPFAGVKVEPNFGTEDALR